LQLGVTVKLRAVLAALLCALWIPGADAAPEEVSLVFVGDIMLDGLPGAGVARGVDPFSNFAELLASSDLAVGNLECAVATTGTPEDKRFTFRAHPRTLPVLARHFGAVGLANNHSGDYGKAALSETMAGLRAQGVPFFGAGKDLAAAHQPLIVERKGLYIALLGYDEFKPRSFEAGADYPGVAWTEDEQVLADIQQARASGADLVFPFLHWGWEGEPEPCARQRTLAHAMIDAGADAVIGGHPHVTQGVETYHGKLILYSLGNFVFDGFHEVATTTGWLLRLSLNRHGVVRWDTVVAKLDDQGSPHPALDAESPCGSGREILSCLAGQR
jgi:poly-gamma-glutamate capsule biosynthesis protein CapA/YwtB (metallophosphatase superfamily)